MRSSKSLDMTQGSVLKKLLAFVIPAILTNLIQQTYTIADRVVVGRFAADGTTALAAVGSTAQITTLFLNLFVGMSIGANVVCANLRGAKDQQGVERCMHTAVLFSAICGVCVGVVGILLCRPLLLLLDTPRTLLDAATLYTRIYFLGMPGSLVYNFGANLLRANGDTRRPMYILSATGVVNVCLNLVLVIGCGMSVAGVAIATITAQYLSAISVLWILFSPKGEYGLSVKKLRLDKKMVASIAKIGIPGGLNGMVFTLSNAVVLTAVNSFNSAVISAAKTAANDLNIVMYQVVAGVYMGCVSASGQCYGAKKYSRIDRYAAAAMGLGSSILAVVGVCFTIFGRQLLGLFNDNPEVIDAGMGPLMLHAWFYVLYLFSEVPLGCLRGMKKSVLPGVLNLIGICLPRVLWTLLVFPMHRSLTFLFVCYPISWLFSAMLQWIYYLYCRKKLLLAKLVPAQQ